MTKKSLKTYRKKLFPGLSGWLVLLPVIFFFGCKAKEDAKLYLPMSLDYNQEFLSQPIEFEQPGIAFQTIQGWTAMGEQELAQLGALRSDESNLILLAGYQLAGENCLNLVGLIDAHKDAAGKPAQDYINAMAAQADSVLTIGRFRHNEINFDQIILTKNNLIYLQLIGSIKDTSSKFTVSYIFPQVKYSDLIKKVEASIASINIKEVL